MTIADEIHRGTEELVWVENGKFLQNIIIHTQRGLTFEQAYRIVEAEWVTEGKEKGFTR